MTADQRTENFERVKAQLEQDGYQAVPATISVLKANLMALVTAGPIALLCTVIFFLVHQSGTFGFAYWMSLAVLPAFFASMVLHEGLHGLGWRPFCKRGWKSLYIGVLWKKLTPFCCCMEPLGFGAYLFGGLFPLLVLGLGLFGVALVTGNIFWLFLSVLNILSAGGDTTIVLMLCKYRKALIMDHPTECGFWAFEKERSGRK